MRLGKLLLLGLVLSSLATREGAGQAVNLARTARVKVSSEYDQRYLARFAVDGQIPAGDSKADVSKAWAVLGSEARHQARFTLEWDKPVKVGEIVYYGRTAWLATECWKDYEVYLDEAAKPAAKGTFQVGSGAQRIKLQPSEARKITLKFLSSYGGPNPGASEIEVYEVSPPEGALPKFVKYVPPQEKPWRRLRTHPNSPRWSRKAGSPSTSCCSSSATS